jgi:hypothetical protein
MTLKKPPVKNHAYRAECVTCNTIAIADGKDKPITTGSKVMESQSAFYWVERSAIEHGTKHPDHKIGIFEVIDGKLSLVKQIQ